MSPTTFNPGARLGPYEIVAPLGAGGMGEVYRARDTKLNRDVAIKVLLPAVANDPDRLARFQREAQVLASLNHPHIAAIYGLEDADGTKALVLELVEGPTLADRIAQGAIPLDEALRIARQIAEAVEAAHEQGIIHRDLKPANIKVRPDGTVKVLDFGLAKALDQGSGIGAQGSANAMNSPTLSMQATQAGIILGTAAYMSPEQASGKPVDKRADIWAFGVVVREMLTGRQTFEGETISHVLAAVLTRQPDLADVPLRVHPLLVRCLEKDPKKRLRDIGDAMDLVQEPAVPIHDLVPARRWPVALGWAAAGILAAVLGVALRSRPSASTEDVVAPPIVRFQIERSSVDPYNSATSAFAVSPDGRFLAHYTAGSNGQATLSVRTLATGESREVSGSAILTPQTPFWSADSRQVAYVTAVAAHVFNVSTSVTGELCTCRFRGGSWNRGGVILLGSPANGHEPIVRLTLEDRAPVPVTKIDPAKGEQDTLPVFLPDGRRFLFTRVRPGSATVTYLGTLDGAEPKRITDGSRSLVAASRNGLGPRVLGIDAAGLVAQPFDLNTMTVIGEPLIIVPAVAAASVSDNGVLATSAPGSRPITLPTWFDRTGTNLGSIGAPGVIQSVNLSPDGRTVAVGEVRASRGNDLWLRNLEGANRRLTFSDEGGGDAPAWSPDGRRIIVSSRRGGVTNIYERAADGSGQETRLFQADRNTYVNDWSRDGRWVIYTMPKGGTAGTDFNLDLWVFPMDGASERKPVPYLTTPAREAQAEFSPDGRFVAYTSTTAGDPEVYVQPFPNAADGKWLISSGGGAEPHWSRDGKELFYFAGQTLMAVPVRLQPTFSNGSPTRLFDAPVQPWYVNDSDRSQVAPDGKRFLLLVPAGKNVAPPIDILVNWLSLLKK